MISHAKCMQSGLVALILVFLIAVPSEGKIIHWPDSAQNRQDLLLLGFGEFTMHGLDVSGNKEAFEAANPNLEADFSTNYRLSLFANGNATQNFLVNGAVIVDSRIGDEYQTVDPSVFRLRMSVETTEPLWDGWRFTGEGLYDPARQWELENLDTRLLTQPQEEARLELLMRLESDDHGYIDGGSLRPSFEGAKFTLHQRSLFGAYANLHSGPVGVEAVGGKLEGKSFREGTSMGVRADGTSGPFELSHAPITRGSDEVKVEVRDRFNESTVLSSTTLIRDIDYTVDYLLGEVLLHQPVASETVTGDPVYVVITFDYLREENDDIMGGRAKLTPVEGLQVSGTYLHRNIDDGATGSGVDEPENLIGADATLTLEDHTTGYFEIAGTENPNLDDDFTALRLGAETKIIDNLILSAGFQKIDDQFRSFTNSDLDPNKNQQRLNFGGDYQLTSKQKVTASYVNIQGLEANGDFNTYDGERDEKIIAAGYRNNMLDEFGFGISAERRDVEDALNANHEDNYQNRAIVDLGGRFEDLAFFGAFGYKANYELAMFRNDLDIGDHDANTNQLAVTLTSDPSERTSFEVSQRFTLRKDRELEIFDERQDATFVTAKIRPCDNVNSLMTYEYKRYTAPGGSVQFWQDDPTRADWAATFALEYLPLKKVKAVGKFGRSDSKKWSTDSTTHITDDFLLGQVTWFPTHHLSFDAESEYRLTEREFTGASRDKTWDLGLRLNWNRDRLNEFTAGLIRRWQLQEYPPTDDITSTSYIMLLSGALSLTHEFFARASVKEILLNEPLDDEKTYTKLEVGYDSHDWYRVSIGYERIESDNDLQPDQNYTGQGLFIRFSGKM